MNQTQLEAVAAGFVQALYESGAVRSSWSALAAAGNWAGVCQLIQQTLGLAQQPTLNDLAAMRTYTQTYVPASPTTVQDDYPSIDGGIIFNGADGNTRG